MYIILVFALEANSLNFTRINYTFINVNTVKPVLSGHL